MKINLGDIFGQPEKLDEPTKCTMNGCKSKPVVRGICKLEHDQNYGKTIAYCTQHANYAYKYMVAVFKI